MTLDKLIEKTKIRTVLLVEDDDKVRTSILFLLNQFFDNIIEAKDGIEALECYQKYHLDTNSYFDIVFSDIEMPNLDGIELVKQIYTLNHKQKIIVISAYSDKEYLIPLINLGINNFIQKPVELNNLLEILINMAKEFWCINIDLGKNYFYDGEYIIDSKTRIALTKNEIMLLNLFLLRKGEYITLKTIHNHIFFDDPLKNFSSDAIRSLIKRLRKKLPIESIVNNRTLGYTLNIK